MKYILTKEQFEQTSGIIGYYYDPENFDEDFPFDVEKIGNDAYKLAVNCGLTILSDKNLFYFFYDHKFKRMIAALFVGITGEVYSFDICVNRSYENMGFATKLVKIAIEDFKYNKDTIKDLHMEIDCINPIMAKILSRKFKFKKGAQLDVNRCIMIKY
jgi:ribosomal protein S18 acetylase RimI-like enzyme